MSIRFFSIEAHIDFELVVMERYSVPTLMNAFFPEHYSFGYQAFPVFIRVLSCLCVVFHTDEQQFLNS